MENLVTIRVVLDVNHAYNRVGFEKIYDFGNSELHLANYQSPVLPPKDSLITIKIQHHPKRIMDILIDEQYPDAKGIVSYTVTNLQFKIVGSRQHHIVLVFVKLTGKTSPYQSFH